MEGHAGAAEDAEEERDAKDGGGHVVTREKGQQEESEAGGEVGGIRPGREGLKHETVHGVLVLIILAAISEGRILVVARVADPVDAGRHADGKQHANHCEEEHDHMQQLEVDDAVWGWLALEGGNRIVDCRVSRASAVEADSHFELAVARPDETGPAACGRCRCALRRLLHNKCTQHAPNYALNRGKTT